MATQKQRRRRAKEKRHEYDLVYVDEEGVEQVVERDEARKTPAKGSSGKASSGKSRSTATRRGREVQPPSWRKVFKRAAIFAPAFFLLVLLLDRKMSYTVALFNMLMLMAVFVPFSYFMDRVIWRQQQKRLNRGP